MKKHMSFKGIALALVSGLVIVGSLVGGSVALAANDDALLDTPPGTPGPFQQLREQALENFYQRIQLAAQEQQLRITFANQVADSVQAWITTLKSSGKDTSTLETALADFKSKVASAQTAHNQATSVLSTHAGFDGSGKVTDAELARKTLQDARDDLRTAHQSLQDGTIELRRAVRDFRQKNRPDKGQTPTAPTGQTPS
jgi:hypothetical protein